MFARIVQLAFVISLAFSVAGGVTSSYLLGETANNQAQEDSEQSQLIDKAEKNKYTTRLIMVVGNEHTRDRVLRRRIVLVEGDIFRKSLLERSVKNLSKLKIIEPIRVSDVEIKLDRENKEIKFYIKVKEKQP